MALCGKSTKHTFYAILAAAALCIVFYRVFRARLLERRFVQRSQREASAETGRITVNEEEAQGKSIGPHAHDAHVHTLGYLLRKWEKRGDAPPLGLLALAARPLTMLSFPLNPFRDLNTDLR